jgi:tetratricopeptide (TPR) repeat protein
VARDSTGRLTDSLRLPPRPAQIGAALVGVLLGLCVGAPARLAAQPTGVDETVAAGYYRRAEELYRSGDSARALELVGRSLEFQSDFSDSLYLRGLIAMQGQETLYRARSSFRLALESGNWLSVAPREAQSRLVRVLVLTRRFEEADGVLRSLAPDLGLGGGGSPGLAELWAKTLVGLGRSDSAEAQLERALQRYPEASELYVLAADLLVRRRRAPEAAALLDRGLGESPKSVELLFARARVESDRGRRLEFLQRYFDAGGDDPAEALLMVSSLLLSDDSAEQAQSALERFFRLGGGRQVQLVDRLRGELLEAEAASGEGTADETPAVGMGASGGEPAVAAAAEGPQGEGPPGPSLYARLLQQANAAVSGYSGERVVDADGDGLYEELYRYADGRLTSWLLDQDQDGLPEARVEFVGVEPGRMLFPPREASEESVEYMYRRHPYVDRIVYVGGGSRRVYHLIPFRYAAQALAPVTVPASGASALAPGHPLERRLIAGPAMEEGEARGRSSSMEEYRLPAGEEERTADRVYTLLKGETVRIDEDPDPRGRYRRYVLFAGGTPVTGYRDLDDDGRFEVSEQYASGALQRIALDQDGDGNQELVELFEAGSPLASEKRWDYDDDGRFDSRELTLAGGATVREFSSGLDGRFDLRAVFRNGRLEEFRRQGRLLPVSYDPARNLYRIGAALGPGDLPSVLTEGLHRAGGRRLFVFDYGGNTYIGELE